MSYHWLRHICWPGIRAELFADHYSHAPILAVSDIDHSYSFRFAESANSTGNFRCWCGGVFGRHRRTRHGNGWQTTLVRPSSGLVGRAPPVPEDLVRTLYVLRLFARRSRPKSRQLFHLKIVPRADVCQSMVAVSCIVSCKLLAHWHKS
jgi:hypothetical protein